MKKAWHLTLEEYKRDVSPLIKEFNKFLKSNRQYLKRQGYNGFIHATPSELFKTKNQTEIDREHFYSEWTYRNLVEPDFNVPKEVIQTYKDYIEKLKDVFGEKNLTKIEADEYNSNKRTVKRAMDDDTIVNELIDGELTVPRLLEVTNSLGINLPKRILELKSKIETQKYDRSKHEMMAKLDREFITSVREFLKPYVQILKDRVRNRIEGLVDDYINSAHNSVSQYASFKARRNRSEYNDISQTLYKYTTKKQRSDDFDKKIEAEENAYVASFINDFVFRINEKLVVPNQKYGHPKLKIKDISFSSGKMQGEISASYGDKIQLAIKLEVILAGGHNIQALHNRYLIKLFKDGKMIKMEDVDKIGESRIMMFESFVNMQYNQTDRLNEAKWNPLRKKDPKEPSTYNLTGYHATLLDNWAGIKRFGLIPGKKDPSGQTWKGEYSRKGSYMHLTFPEHELSNGYDEVTGEPYSMVIEFNFNLEPGYIVPDEEAGTSENTAQIIKEKGPIVVGITLPTNTIKRIHLIDSASAKKWGEANKGKYEVKYHKIEDL